ncbi:MAG: hypothetical protein IPK50_23680 [Fibrobacterota bacterium]|nr:MAG: hypothetical protein IPK50_23680 [Fibrobacterota bacterium]
MRPYVAAGPGCLPGHGFAWVPALRAASLARRGSLLWEGQAKWTESGWRVPSKHRGLAVLHARTPSGTRSERIFLTR